MSKSDTADPLKEFDEIVEGLRKSFESKDTEGMNEFLPAVFSYVIHYLRERNREKLAHVGRKLALLDFLFDYRGKDHEIARGLGYLQGLENVVRKMTHCEVKGEIFGLLKKEPRHAQVLGAIKREGAIQHAELASRLGVSSDTLDQILDVMAASGAITTTTYGQTRYYSLTDVGETIQEKTRKQAFVPELASRLKNIYGLVAIKRKSVDEVVQLLAAEDPDWGTEEEIRPMVEVLAELAQVVRVQAPKSPPRAEQYHEFTEWLREVDRDFREIYSARQEHLSCVLEPGTPWPPRRLGVRLCSRLSDRVKIKEPAGEEWVVSRFAKGDYPER
jgi:DNA-binding MarR family transcriptional regulator